MSKVGNSIAPWTIAVLFLISISKIDAFSVIATSAISSRCSLSSGTSLNAEYLGEKGRNDRRTFLANSSSVALMTVVSTFSPLVATAAETEEMVDDLAMPVESPEESKAQQVSFKVIRKEMYFMSSFILVPFQNKNGE